MHLKELLIICSEHCPQDLFKSINNLPPSYLADRLSYQRPSRNLWSTSQQLLEPRKLTGT
ncbi:unnamed protein product [Porites evermanni]|uniref:Uncharacterized protein n=1 Tax=Porites evermanni TaxID=104178 RepID=A0ABN8SJV9_9CNID|nr:unnamed protein product [Porites evermanni]